MFVLTSKYDNFTHRVGEIDSLEALVFGLSNDRLEAKRIAVIAKKMKPNDVFCASGIAIFCQEDK